MQCLEGCSKQTCFLPYTFLTSPLGLSNRSTQPALSYSGPKDRAVTGAQAHGLVCHERLRAHSINCFTLHKYWMLHSICDISVYCDTLINMNNDL